MMPERTMRVAVNGYGVIGKRVADTIAVQHDMTLVDVDCTPKKFDAKNAEAYRRVGAKFIVEEGEEHAVAGHSFVAEANYASALGREATRIVSCNTTSIVHTLTALKRAGILLGARGTLLRRATDPWESHLGGTMNTLVPESHISRHQGRDARSVDPELDAVPMAAKVSETLGHLHTGPFNRPSGGKQRSAFRARQLNTHWLHILAEWAIGHQHRARAHGKALPRQSRRDLAAFALTCARRNKNQSGEFE